MLQVVFESNFKRKFKKVKDKELKNKIIKQIYKIKSNFEIGKPMRFGRKGTRELYIPPFRLSYKAEKNIIYILDLYHKDKQ